ncbi:Threonine efflux protein [Sodalis glossinidius str. 'morsitans']|uniref:Threonine efflux protein n=1 Tax=Sodalis glossinidius (strain morsitans) TaxID=343509 RepID=A0A193QP32_SODGM|nr:Threonine efflux protein [Sodalis glossinidius str. 'morsitans']
MFMLFVTVALVHLIALMSPGPDSFFVSQTAASRSRRQAMYGVLGIILGVAIWAAVCIFAGWAGNCCAPRADGRPRVTRRPWRLPPAAGGNIAFCAVC